MIERRKHKRYSMPRGTFAILRNELEQLNDYRRMSIGEIAMVLYKSEAQVIGQVVNMSFGGMAFVHSDCQAPRSDQMQLDLLFAEQGIYLHNVPFRPVRVSPIGGKGKKADNSQRIALQFETLDPLQSNELRELITYHTE